MEFVRKVTVLLLELQKDYIRALNPVGTVTPMPLYPGLVVARMKDQSSSVDRAVI